MELRRCVAFYANLIGCNPQSTAKKGDKLPTDHVYEEIFRFFFFFFYKFLQTDISDVVLLKSCG